MTVTLVIGVDPGATTGLCALSYTNGGSEASAAIVVRVWQCTPDNAIEWVKSVLRTHRGHVWLALEQFVVGPRASKSATAAAGRATRQTIAELSVLPVQQLITAPAVRVKRWSTDKRLTAAGLFEPTIGRPHARDAARHALYAAVKAGLVRDPLFSIPESV